MILSPDLKTQMTAPPAIFRKWLKRALFELETNPAELARRAEVGANTAGTFLREDRDIRLGVAHKLHMTALAIAVEKGIALPTLEEVSPNA